MSGFWFAKMEKKFLIYNEEVFLKFVSTLLHGV